MSIKLLPLFQQVVFLADATTRMGEFLLHRAVEQGAKVFMLGQDEDVLQRLQDEMRLQGYDTAYAVANFHEPDQIQFAFDQCLKTFGEIHTLINNTHHLQLLKIAQKNLNPLGAVMINVAGVPLTSEFLSTFRKEVRFQKLPIKISQVQFDPSFDSLDELGQVVLQNAVRPKRNVRVQKQNHAGGIFGGVALASSVLWFFLRRHRRY